MERRACERIPVNLAVTFICCSRTMSGTVINVSENGMFIRTRGMCIPHDSQLEVQLPVQNSTNKLSASLVRFTMTPDSDGIGVLLKAPTEEYLSYIKSHQRQD